MRGVVGGLGIGVKVRMLDILRILNILSTSDVRLSKNPLPNQTGYLYTTREDQKCQGQMLLFVRKSGIFFAKVLYFTTWRKNI